MLTLILALPVMLIKLVLNIILFIPLLAYKIAINHKASVIAFSTSKKQEG